MAGQLIMLRRNYIGGGARLRCANKPAAEITENSRLHRDLISRLRPIASALARCAHLVAVGNAANPYEKYANRGNEK